MFNILSMSDIHLNVAVNHLLKFLSRKFGFSPAQFKDRQIQTEIADTTH
jgi:hypothetical protein